MKSSGDPGLPRCIILAVNHVIEKVAQERRGAIAGRTGGIGAAHPCRWKRPLHRVGGVIVELPILLGRAFPVADIGLVPDFPEPRFYFLAPVLPHAVRHPLVDQLGPLGIVLGWIRPAQEDVVVLVAGRPMVAIRLRVGGERLRHEANLHQRLHLALHIGIEDPVGDGPVVNRVAVAVFGVRVSRAPLQGRLAIARHQQAVNPHVHRNGAERRNFGQQFAAVLHIGVVGLIVTEERPDWFQRTVRRPGVHADRHGILGQAGNGGQKK